jgi:hypothetical protein
VVAPQIGDDLPQDFSGAPQHFRRRAPTKLP